MFQLSGFYCKLLPILSRQKDVELVLASTWRLLCSSFLGSILESLIGKQVIARKELHRILQVMCCGDQEARIVSSKPPRTPKALHGSSQTRMCSLFVCHGFSYLFGGSIICYPKELHSSLEVYADKTPNQT